MSRDRVLAVCSFFPESSLVHETVRALGEGCDLLLVPIGTEAGAIEAIPEVARPHLVETVLGPLPAPIRPFKKWRTIRAVLERVGTGDHDWFFFPDDDLEYPAEFLNRFLDVLRRHDVALAQPALTPDSYLTWEICRQEPGSLLRLTNFVEIMTPCFRRDALAALWPSIDAETSPMGYGFDLHWGFACESLGLRSGIVDATPVAHRFRPVGTHYAGDDLHGQGYAYGSRFPRLLPHEICVRETIAEGDG